MCVCVRAGGGGESNCVWYRNLNNGGLGASLLRTQGETDDGIS